MIETLEITKFAYLEHIHNYGKPDESIRFSKTKLDQNKEKVLSSIDVLVWHSNKEIDITTFSTIGMCGRPMPQVNHRTELHFALTGKLDEVSVNQIAKFLANLAVYPLINNTFFDWWHIHTQPGKIPLFNEASIILFYPAFVDQGWNDFYFHGTRIKILNLVPITANEHKIINKQGLSSFIDYLNKNEIDFFSPR